MKRRRFLKQMTVTPVVAAHLTSPTASEGKKRIKVAATGESVPKPLPPWAGVEAKAWANESKATILTDMSQCQPASALSPRLKTGHWKVIPYELQNGTSGKLVYAAVEAEAPVLKLPLNVKGWHAIFVGLYCSAMPPSMAWLKLDGDAAPVPRVLKVPDELNSVADVFFKVADLKGQNLYIGQKNTGYTAACGVAYVKLIPLTDDEVAGFRADLNDQSHRRLAATVDGYSFIYDRRPVTKEELLSEVEVFRDSDFDTILLHAIWGGDKVTYPSKFGTIPGLEMEGQADPGHRYFVESMRELMRKNINPVKVLIDGAHDMGIKVHVGVRPAGWNFGEVFSEFWVTPFWKQHPEWRCIDRDGSETTRMSWAFPEVRQHVIGGLQEAVSFGADGVHVVFCRGVPVVLYEQPFLEMFKKQYGEDPRKLDEETDPRIRKAWANIVTTFMREARAMLDQEQKRRGGGKRLELSAMVFGNEYDNMLYGLDVRQWVAEGLIDEIFAYKWDIGARKRFDDIDFYMEICRPKGIPYRPSYTTLPATHANTLSDALSWYEKGVKGFSFWDAGQLSGWCWTCLGPELVAPGTVIARMGHVEELRLRDPKDSGTAKRLAQLRFKSVGGVMNAGRFPPWAGG